MKSISISTIADMLCAHRNILDTPGDTDTDTEEWKEVRLEDLVKKFTKYLTHSDAFLSQNACLAMCKLILHDVLPPPAPGTTEPSLIPEFLKSLTMLYFNPNSEVGDSPAERMRYKQTVQQTLSYCLPAFCHRRLSNALLMAQTTVFIMEKLVMKKKENEEFAEDEDDMAGWPSITGQFAEWTDPRKVLKPNGLPQDATAPLPPTAEDPHVCLAISILTRVLSHSSSKDEKKPMLMLLGKLNVASSSAFLTAGGTPEPVDKNKDDVDILRKLHNLTEECIEAQIGPDAKSTSSLAKVEAVVGAKLAQIEDSDTTVRPSAERASRSSVGEQSDVDGTEQTERRGPQPPAQTLEQVDEEEEEEDTMFGGVQAEGTRMPLEEEDEEEDDDDTVTGAEKAPSNRRTPGRRSKSRATVTESDIIDSLLESEME
jgi:condensin complex subunit 3